MKYFLTIIIGIFSLTISISQEKVDKSVVGSGATKSDNGTVFLKGTLGQATIGKTRNNNDKASIGFWEVINASMTTSIEEVDIGEIPQGIFLGQNYPNPANQETRIQLKVPERMRVSIHLIGMNGQRIGVMLQEDILAGNYVITTDVSHLPEGQYLYVLYEGQRIISSKKMLVSHKK